MSCWACDGSTDACGYCHREPAEGEGVGARYVIACGEIAELKAALLLIATHPTPLTAERCREVAREALMRTKP